MTRLSTDCLDYINVEHKNRKNTMATAIQWRRGNTSQTANFTGLVGEITVDTDLSTVIVHDGSTAGGHRIAKYTEVTSAAAGDSSSVVAGNGLT